MFQTMLHVMEERASASLEQKKSAMALWFKQWAAETLEAFDPNRKVIYTSAYAFPMELLRAFDVVPFDFELASGMIGTTDMMIPTMEAVENQGLSRDVCSFHRASLGAYYLGLFPEPDLLITTSFYCDGKAKTNEILSQLFHKESALLYVPAELSKDSVAYVETQLRQIVRTIEEVTGHSLDEDRLRDSIRSSNRARESQQRLLELLKHKPSPWGGRHLISYSINGQVFAGTPVLDQLNHAFIGELEERISSGSLRDEAHRIYWFAWLPTYRTMLFDVLKQHRVSIPMCETMRIYCDEIDEENPFEGLALKCLRNPFVGSGSRRLEGMTLARDEFAIDGAILFATQACRQSTAAFRVLSDSLASLDIPLLVLDLDIGDARSYSAEQTSTRIEAFVEQLDQRRR